MYKIMQSSDVGERRKKKRKINCHEMFGRVIIGEIEWTRMRSNGSQRRSHGIYDGTAHITSYNISTHLLCFISSQQKQTNLF